MTRYTVVWLDDALNELAAIWTKSTARDAVTAASNVVDVELAEDPDQKGVEKEPGIRQLIARPLLVLFRVREADRIVEVSSVNSLSALFSGNGAPLP